ncbi:pyruvate formate lyase family protein, partial [Peptacetobacter sp.]
EQLGPKTGELEELDSIEKIFEAYQKQMEYFVRHLAEADNAVDYAHAERAPLPFMSAMVDDCIKEGKTAQEGGAIYNFTGPQAFGVADSGDSLYAIKKHVFDDKKISLKELKEALESNFGVSDCIKPSGCKEPSISGASLSEAEIYEAVKKILASTGSIDIATLEDKLTEKIATPSCQSATCCGESTGKFTTIRKILQNTDSFGNDIEEVDEFARRCGKIYCNEVDKYVNPRGGQFQAGIYPVSANVLFGKDVLALPDGRLAHEPLADGVSPRQGVDTHGPTAASNSVAKLDHAQASNGTLYNQKFTPAAVSGEQGLKNFVSIVKSFFDHKGSHVQFNVVDKETLLEAQQHPEEHQDLIVRVAGYSAHFVTLAKEVQDDIINRTEHNM